MRKKSNFRNDYSPVFPTIVLRLHEDTNGESIMTLEEDDISSSVLSKGRFQDWSLDSLTKAGIDPRFGIHTTGVARSDNSSALQSSIDEVNKALDALDESKKTV